jgi:hypothetical protein
MPMWVKRVEAHPLWYVAIVEAVALFELTAIDMVARYRAATEGLPMTERPVNLFAAELKL